jgi:hypothetical protein
VETMAKSYGPPMTLANMKANGVRFVSATCETCGHDADVNVDSAPRTIAAQQESRTRHAPF